mmetsp:Transcript_31658/g.100952  ORF Transcript_31658/g.100952 Transcript_31658/m.100952 type:complete len:321 (-) Transcript_31658:213-1175(-)
MSEAVGQLLEAEDEQTRWRRRRLRRVARRDDLPLKLPHKLLRRHRQLRRLPLAAARVRVWRELHRDLEEPHRAVARRGGTRRGRPCYRSSNDGRRRRGCCRCRRRLGPCRDLRLEVAVRMHLERCERCARQRRRRVRREPSLDGRTLVGEAVREGDGVEHQRLRDGAAQVARRIALRLLLLRLRRARYRPLGLVEKPVGEVLAVEHEIVTKVFVAARLELVEHHQRPLEFLPIPRAADHTLCHEHNLREELLLAQPRLDLLELRLREPLALLLLLVVIEAVHLVVLAPPVWMHVVVNDDLVVVVESAVLLEEARRLVHRI